MRVILLVFLGAGVGGVLRHGVNVASLRALGPDFPWGTMIVNVAGSFVMGLLAVLLASRVGGGWTQDLRLLLMTGVLGGFTTFSAFSLDALNLLDDGRLAQAAAYAGASVVLSVAALWAGAMLMRSL